MQFKSYRTLQDLEELKPEWNRFLAQCSASHVPFLRFEYLSNWWQTLGGGEWTSGDLFVVAGRESNGEIAGIAPLFFSRNLQGEPALMLLGSIEISDYLDLIAPESGLAAFSASLLEFLDSPQAPPWKALDWYNIPEASPTMAPLQSAAEKRGWDLQQFRLQPCPYIALPGDWETYLAGIDKKQRHEIRRKLRRAEEYTPPVNWYVVQEKSRLESEMEDFFTLMAHDPEKARFLSPAMRRQMHLTAQAAFDQGWLLLAFLEVGGRKAAGYLNFDYAGHLWVYNSGLDFEMRELSPGWVLLTQLLKWANENGRNAVDFMRGDEDYKYRFGAVNRYVTRVLICRS